MKEHYRKVLIWLEHAKENNLATAVETLDEPVAKAIAQNISGMMLQKRESEYIEKEVVSDVAGFLEGRQDWTPSCVKYLEYNLRKKYGIRETASVYDKIGAE